MTGIIGEVSLISSIGVHHIDFIVPSPMRHKGNVFTVWGP